MNLKMPAEPSWLSSKAVGRPTGVDRKNEVLQGYVVAQEGPFKSNGRGEFDEASLRAIVKLANESASGLKSRFCHPDMSSDGLGKFLGRSRDFTMSTAKDARTGQTVKAVRADLHFDPSAHETPSGDLANYVMTLAESDPDAISSSLVLKCDEECRLEKDGTRMKDKDGNPLPPLWRPKILHASDIVDTGDAVDSLLSVSDLPMSQLWQGEQMLNEVFAGQPREVVEARCRAYLGTYLDRTFGPSPTPRLDARLLQLEEMNLELRRNIGMPRLDARRLRIDEMDLELRRIRTRAR